MFREMQCVYTYMVLLWSSGNDIVVWIDHSKDMSACFYLHQLWFQCIKFSYVEVMTDKTCVFLPLIAKMSDQFQEQWFNIKFCVKLGENASDTCEMLSEA